MIGGVPPDFSSTIPSPVSTTKSRKVGGLGPKHWVRLSPASLFANHLPQSKPLPSPTLSMPVICEDSTKPSGDLAAFSHFPKLALLFFARCVLPLGHSEEKAGRKDAYV